MSFGFTLPEELVLLGLDEQTHRFKIHYRSMKSTFSVGASFLELLLQKRIRLDEKGKVEVVNPKPTGVSFLDRVLMELSESKKRRKLKNWIIHFHNRWKLLNGVHEDILEELARKNALDIQKKKFLLVIPVRRFVVQEQAQERVIQKIRAEMLEEGPVDERTATLCILLKECKLIQEYFSNYEQDALQKKLEELKEKHESAEWIKAIERAVQEIQVAVIIPAAAT